MREPYSKKDIKFIKDNYQNMHYKDIAEKLGRTKNAIAVKISELGLKKERKSDITKYIETRIAEGLKNAEIVREIKEKFNVYVTNKYVSKHRCKNESNYVPKENVSCDERKLTSALDHTRRILGFKENIKKGDIIKLIFEGNVFECEVKEKYPSFIRVEISGRLENVMYNDIISIVKRSECVGA